jgi:hypothetical protein
VIQYLKGISILYLVFLVFFPWYIISKIVGKNKSFSYFILIHSLFNLNFHFDIASISTCFIFFYESKYYIFEIEAFLIIEICFTYFLARFKKWKAFLSLFGFLTTVLMIHYGNVSIKSLLFQLFWFYFYIFYFLLVPCIYKFNSINFQQDHHILRSYSHTESDSSYYWIFY